MFYYAGLYWPIGKVVLGFVIGGLVAYLLLERLRKFTPITKKERIVGYLTFYVCFAIICIGLFIYPLLSLRAHYVKVVKTKSSQISQEATV